MTIHTESSQSSFELPKHNLRARAKVLELATAGASPPDTMRQRARAADEAASVTLSLGLLCRELFTGLCKIADAFFTEQRAFLLTTAEPYPISLSATQVRILKDVLAGVDQNVVAIDMNLSAATVATRARQAFDNIGIVRGRPSRPHPVLMLAAQEFVAPESALVGRLSFIDGDRPMRVISVPRVEDSLAETLPPAEHAIIRALVQGDCYADIARHRNTALRTVANQVGAVFKKLGVSGRNMLMLRLLSDNRSRFLV